MVCTGACVRLILVSNIGAIRPVYLPKAVPCRIFHYLQGMPAGRRNVLGEPLPMGNHFYVVLERCPKTSLGDQGSRLIQEASSIQR